MGNCIIVQKSGSSSSYTGGNGISIASDGTISNAFAYLNAQDLNDLSTYFVGYAYSCTNRPSGSSIFGTLISIVGAGRRSQQYTSLYDGKIYTRKYYGSTWSDWTEVVRSYVAGDTITIANNSSNDIICNGCVTTNGTELYFHLPLDAPVGATNVMLSSLYIIPRGDKGYMAGDSMFDVCANSAYTVTAKKAPNGLTVSVKKSSAFTATNNTPISVQVRGRTITLS